MPKPNPAGPFSPSPIDPSGLHRCQATDRGKELRPHAAPPGDLRGRASSTAGRAPLPGELRPRAPLPEAKPAALTAPALTPSNSRPIGTRRHFNLPRPPVPQPPTALSRRPKPGVSRAHCWLQKTCRCIPIPLIPIPLHARFSAQLNFLYFSLVAERSRQR